jgi:hypothetical protein
MLEMDLVRIEWLRLLESQQKFLYECFAYRSGSNGNLLIDMGAPCKMVKQGGQVQAWKGHLIRRWERDQDSAALARRRDTRE